MLALPPGTTFSVEYVNPKGDSLYVQDIRPNSPLSLPGTPAEQRDFTKSLFAGMHTSTTLVNNYNIQSVIQTGNDVHVVVVAKNNMRRRPSSCDLSLSMSHFVSLQQEERGIN